MGDVVIASQPLDLQSLGARVADVWAIINQVPEDAGAHVAWARSEPEGLAQVTRAVERAEQLLASGDFHTLQAEIDVAAQPAGDDLVRQELARLVAAFPNAGKANLAPYGAVLFDEVMTARPTSYGVVTACRSLVRGARFLPPVADVLTAIADADATLRGRRKVLEIQARRVQRAREFLNQRKA